MTNTLFKLILVIFIFVGITGFGVYLWLNQQLSSIEPGSDQETVFVIARGESPKVIAQRLEEKRLIRHRVGFLYVVARDGLSRNIQSGSFRLSPGMDTSEIALTLTKGTLDTWVTLLEGWRREEMAKAIDVAMRDVGANFEVDTFLELTEGKEGFLFPDTYLIPIGASEVQIVSILENTFNQRITDQMQNDIESRGYSLEQAVTMASLIEREANTDEARRMVSGILWNRLENDWPLQVDATLQYPKGFDPNQNTWWPTPRAADKDIDSPYNTYKYQGLPPAPIANPSLSSIMAAIYPQESPYWFYITGNDGRMYYAVTLDQHNENIRNHLR